MFTEVGGDGEAHRFATVAAVLTEDDGTTPISGATIDFGLDLSGSGSFFSVGSGTTDSTGFVQIGFPIPAVGEGTYLGAIEAAYAVDGITQDGDFLVYAEPQPDPTPDPSGPPETEEPEVPYEPEQPWEPYPEESTAPGLPESTDPFEGGETYDPYSGESSGDPYSDCTNDYTGDSCVNSYTGGSNMDPYGGGACINPFRGSSNDDAYTSDDGDYYSQFEPDGSTRPFSNLSYSPYDVEVSRAEENYSPLAESVNQTISAYDTPDEAQPSATPEKDIPRDLLLNGDADPNGSALTQAIKDYLASRGTPPEGMATDNLQKDAMLQLSPEEIGAMQYEKSPVLNLTDDELRNLKDTNVVLSQIENELNSEADAGKYREQPAAKEELGTFERVLGGLQAVGGVVQGVAGVAFALGTAETGVGIGVGLAVAANGFDNAYTGIQRMLGESKHTLTYEGVEYATDSPTAAMAVDLAIPLASGIGMAAATPAKVLSVSGEVGEVGSGMQRVTQFYNELPGGGGFGPGSTEARYAAVPEGLFTRTATTVLEGSTTTPRTWVSPMAASEQTGLSRYLTGMGEANNYVEFTVSTSELNRVGGLKSMYGAYQQVIPDVVSLGGRAPVFGTMAPNYSQYVIIGSSMTVPANAVIDGRRK
jgi:hypothetical protein